MATNPQNVKLGPCKVTVENGVLGDTVFETTKGGVVLNYTETTKEVTIDQYGDTPVKEYVIGRQASVEMPFAEYDLSKLAKLIPGSKLEVDSVDPNIKILKVDGSKVIDLFTYARKVIIEPLDATSTASDTIILYKAAPRPNISYTYDYNNERVTNVTWKAYPDENGLLIAFGDETTVPQA